MISIANNLAVEIFTRNHCHYRVIIEAIVGRFYLDDNNSCLGWKNDNRKRFPLINICIQNGLLSTLLMSNPFISSINHCSHFYLNVSTKCISKINFKFPFLHHLHLHLFSLYFPLPIFNFIITWTFYSQLISSSIFGNR